MRAHRAVDAIAVGQGEPRQAEGVCLLDQLVGATRPFEEREVALAPQRDVGHRVRFPLSVPAPPPAARLGEQPGWRDTIARHAAAPAARGAAVPVSTAGRHPPSVRAVPAQPLPHDLEGHGARRARAASAPLCVHSLGPERGADYVRRLSVIKSARERAKEPPSAGPAGQDADSPSRMGAATRWCACERSDGRSARVLPRCRCPAVIERRSRAPYRRRKPLPLSVDRMWSGAAPDPVDGVNDQRTGSVKGARQGAPTPSPHGASCRLGSGERDEDGRHAPGAVDGWLASPVVASSPSGGQPLHLPD